VLSASNGPVEITAKNILAPKILRLAGPHPRARKLRPNFGTTLATARAREAWLDVRQPDVVGPAVRIGLDVVAAPMVAAVDQHLAHAGCAQLAEGLGVGGRGRGVSIPR
jgi:hypothetical protein